MKKKAAAKTEKSFLGEKRGLAGLQSLSRQDRLMWAAVYLLFAVSTLIRGLILPGAHILNTYYDELLYWGVAKTFWTSLKLKDHTRKLPLLRIASRFNVSSATMSL